MEHSLRIFLDNRIYLSKEVTDNFIGGLRILFIDRAI